MRIVVAGGSGLVGPKWTRGLNDRASTRKLFATPTPAGIGRQGRAKRREGRAALSVVGTERLAPQSGHFRAKHLQEQFVGVSPIPCTIVRAIQFFEFLTTIPDSATAGGVRQVIADPNARYWGVDIDRRPLIPGSGASLFDAAVGDWPLDTAPRS